MRTDMVEEKEVQTKIGSDMTKGESESLEGNNYTDAKVSGEARISFPS